MLTVLRLTILAFGLAALLGAPARAADQSAHAFDFTSIDSKPMPFAQFKGKAVLVVNTASQCGYTPQYKGLQALWDQYRDKDAVVLGVPSNDFGGQEPGSEGEIKEFCETVFGVNFPMTAKYQVIGGDAHPFYQWARQALGDKAVPKWNFHKILIGPDGTAVDAFPSNVEPQSPVITSRIDALISSN